MEQSTRSPPEQAAEIGRARPGDRPFDPITEPPRDTDLAPCEQAGLTWALTFFGPQVPRRTSLPGR